MQKKYLISLIILGILLAFNIFLATSYSLYQMAHKDTTVAISDRGCVSIIYSDSQNYELVNPKGLANEDGMVSTPDTITITNNCLNDQNIEFHLDVLNNSNIDASKIKVYVNGEYNIDPVTLSSLRFIKGSDNVLETFRLLKEKMGAGETKRINFRMWLDEYATAGTNLKNIFATKYYIASSELTMKPSLSEVILNNKTDEISAKTSPDFSSISNIDEGLYKIDNSYYYRGNVSNNYVNFAGFTWKIIRINQDNTIRIIYTGSDLTSKFSDSNNSEEDIGYANSNTDNSSSTVKAFLNDWYENNLLSYDDYIATSDYCNDTSYIMQSRTNYGSYNRLNSSAPSLICPTTDKNYGGTYNQKIGLITADEVNIAGGTINANNDAYYLFDGKDYYTMSPWFMGSQAWEGIVTSSGKIDASIVNTSKEIRPVINLNNFVTITGTGTIDDPYLIDKIA